MDRRHHPLFPHIVTWRVLIAGALAFGLIASACSESEEQQLSTLASDIDGSGTAAANPDVDTNRGETTTIADDPAEFFPDVLAADAVQADDGTWTFSVTLSSPYDTPQQYADAWRVVGPDGTELGFRLLTHDHANEQPFTRSQRGIEIPDGITTVTIEGRDQANGWGGDVLEFELPS